MQNEFPRSDKLWHETKEKFFSLYRHTDIHKPCWQSGRIIMFGSDS